MRLSGLAGQTHFHADDDIFVLGASQDILVQFL